MFVSLGPQAFITPAPVFLVGSYDAEGRPNVMTASWGGICCTQPPCLALSLRRSSWSLRAIRERGAFSVSIPERSQAGAADFAGQVSGRNEDKFQILGLTAAPGEHVDAPFVAECPVVLELLLRHTLELGSHIQLVGEVMDVKVRRTCLNAEGLPDPLLIDALHYAPLIREYHATGDFVARAFAIGKTICRK